MAQIRAHPALSALAGLVGDGGSCSARGIVGSSTAIVAGVLALELRRPILLLTAHLDEADESLEELVDLLPAHGLAGTRQGDEGDAPILRLPALEALPGETSVAVDLLAERLSIARRMLAGKGPSILIASIPALMQGVPAADQLPSLLRIIRPGHRLDPKELAGWLERAGYVRRATVENSGEYAVRGGIIDLFPSGSDAAIRLDLFGDQVERIFEIDLETQASDRRREQVELVGVTVDSILADDRAEQIASHLPTGTVAVLGEIGEILEQGRGYFERVRDGRGIHSPARVLEAIARRCHAVLDVNAFSAGAAPDRAVTLPLASLPPFDTELPEAVRMLGGLAGERIVVVPCDSAGELERMRTILADAAPTDRVIIELRHVHRGFLFGDPVDASLGAERTAPQPLAVVPPHDLLNRPTGSRRVRGSAGGRSREAFLSMQPGDCVVHRVHGIARFLSLQALPPEQGRAGRSGRTEDAPAEEVLTLEFDGGTRLHVPMARIDLVQRYVGAGNAKPTLSRIGGRRWSRAREEAEEAVRDLAEEMLRVQAAREATQGIRYPADTPWQRQFEAEFPYQETEDQVTAIAAIKRDMVAARPMDRLVCGDVGFGKTEVAMRAAFKAVEFGRQVAVLVPTTVLAEQHEQTFRGRFGAYPFRIESISRFKGAAETKRILGELAGGRVDVIIGTHRLLSADIRFADLGLVIVDEEQRFGVEHKQKLLQFRLTADVLTLSATPIPRTLHMSMLGLRDISSLTTPPLDRRAIVTEVIPWSDQRIRQALQREMAREGQAFVVHNRVQDIRSIADDVQRLVPDARIVVGHGQMAGSELESVMLRFMRRKADILVCTTIIESGIDIPSANTMIINNAHMFGLAELHQLRGRVGRSKHRAYCYLLTPGDRPIQEDARKRLRAIEDYSMLGAGFRIAMRDLEIRGAGNLLGADQSGHIAAVGYEMYCQLLEQAVAELRQQPLRQHTDVAIEIGARGAIPRGYIPSDQRRMEAYRRVAIADTVAEVDRIEGDLLSAYGQAPSDVAALLDLARLRCLAGAMAIRSVVRREQDIVFVTAAPAALEAAMRGVQGTLRLVGPGGGEGIAEVYFRPPPAFLEPVTLLKVLIRRLSPQPYRGPT
jgi:transcription-repair coupling factor (superfamily II helicase)